MKQKCKYCKTTIKEENAGYFRYLDDAEQTRFIQLKLQDKETICCECKKELMFAMLIPVI